MKKELIIIVAFFFSMNAICQMAVNQNWQITTGQPDSVAWSNSRMVSGGQVITVGNTTNLNGDADIYIEKVDQFGSLLWSHSFDFDGGDDYGVDLSMDQAGNIFIAAAVWDSTNQNYDFGILKYSSVGNLIWNNSFNSAHNLNDIPADISIHNSSNKIILSGGSEGTNSDVDILTVCVSANSGSIAWTRRYDYANLHDAAVNIRTDLSGEVTVAGASADSNGLYDNVILKYNISGTPIDSARTSMGIGIDEPRAIQTDNQGNYYVTGLYSPQAQNSSIVVYKLDTQLNLEPGNKPWKWLTPRE